MGGGLRGPTVISAASPFNPTLAFHLSAADLLGLLATPIPILAAPPTGQLYMPTACTLVYTAGGTPYGVASGGHFGFNWGSDFSDSGDFGANTPGDICDGADLIDQATNQFIRVSFQETKNVGLPLSRFTGKPLIFGSLFLDPTGGDGTLDGILEYETIVLP